MIFRQLFALTMLRLQLSRNQQLKAGKINLYLSWIAFVFLWLGAVASFFATGFGGAFFFKALSVESCNSIWCVAAAGFIFYWFLMVLGQLQQTETISFEKLLHLPVSLKGAFFLNYLSSFTNSAVWLGAPVLFGLVIGMGLAKGPRMWHLLPATIGLFFVATALTYQLRRLVAKLMENKRLKSFAMVLLPCLMFVFFAMMLMDAGGRDSSWKQGFKTEVGKIFRNGPSTAFVASTFLIAVASLFLSYRSILHQYLGARPLKTKSAIVPSSKIKSDQFMFRKLPWVTEEASAVTMATLRCLSRSPEMLAALIPLVIMFIFGAPYLVGMDGYDIPVVVRAWIPLGIITVNMLSFPAFLFSMFSYDRDGFRAFVLSPMDRVEILKGKNIAVGLLTMMAGVICLIVMQISIPVDCGVLAASLIQLFVCYLMIAVIGNFLSVCFPVGLKRGNMQPANAPVLTTIFLYVGVLGAPVLVVQPASFATVAAMLYNGSFSVVHPGVYLALTLIQLVLVVPLYVIAMRFFGQTLWENQSTIVNTVANLPE